MRRLITLYRSSVGKKIVMAVTGSLLLVFVLGHLAGNLKIYQGQEKFDAYAHWLREMGAPVFSKGQALWIARIGLLATLALHITAATQLTVASLRARHVSYRKLENISFSYASRTMRLSGVLIGVYALYHLSHLTWGVTHHAFSASPYVNVVRGFKIWWVSAIYLTAILLLTSHLYHGIWSAFHTLGINNPRYNTWRRTFASALALLILLGYASIPLSVLAGFVKVGIEQDRRMDLNANIPSGPIEEAWNKHRFEMKLVNPSNKRRYNIIVVGSGLAGASASASLAELGHNVTCITYHDSPRRAHSIAAQGGINAAKNYQNDGDSVFRLFHDTVKVGDFRSREGNVYRLAQVSLSIIDQCVAQGVPFAREYGGYLANRSFGGAQVSRTFYARGQTGQQLLLGAYQALMRQVSQGNVALVKRHEVLDLVVVDGRARGIVIRDLLTGTLNVLTADVVVLATGGYSNVYYWSTNAKASNCTASWRAYKRGAVFANPCFTQIHPTSIPQNDDRQSKLTLMSESLRNDGRIWVPKKVHDARPAGDIPNEDRDYYLERLYPSFGNLTPRDIASRRAKEMVDAGHGVGPLKNGVYLDFSEAIDRLDRDTIAERYGNLFKMYERITGEEPYEVPMRIYPAPHYTMGGLWVDYNLMSSMPGLFVLGEANFSDHGANRLGASALMQGLADGYFIAPYTVGNFLASVGHSNGHPVSQDHPAAREALRQTGERIEKLLAIDGRQPSEALHRKLGKLMLEECGMVRTKFGLESPIDKIRGLRQEFWESVSVPGTGQELNQSLEKANRTADFFELAELMCRDALTREESCGGHFREEHQTDEGEARRDDDTFSHVAVWEYNGKNEPRRHVEQLAFEYVQPSQRSYK